MCGFLRHLQESHCHSLPTCQPRWLLGTDWLLWERNVLFKYVLYYWNFIVGGGPWGQRSLLKMKSSDHVHKPPTTRRMGTLIFPCSLGGGGVGGGCLWNSPRVLLMGRATASVPAHDVFINKYLTNLRPGTALWKQSKCGNIAPTSWFFLFLLVLVWFRYSFDWVHVFAKNCYKSSGKEGRKEGRKGRREKLPSHVPLFATPWTVAYQAPPSMGFSRQ